MNSILKLTFATALPVIVAIAFYLLDKKTKFNTLNEKVKQIIYGVAFGGLAIFGTEWGIPFNETHQSVNVKTLIKICDGSKVTITEYFNDDLFKRDNLDDLD